MIRLFSFYYLDLIFLLIFIMIFYFYKIKAYKNKKYTYKIFIKIDEITYILKK
jgi:hypothetical protein